MCVIVIWNSYITILVLHLVHPSLDSTGFFVVNSVCALVCVKCEKCGVVNSVCALVCVKCEKRGIHISSSSGRLPYCHVRAEHVEETIISGGKLPQPDGCHPVL